MEPKFQVQLKIRKPVTEVFDAVVRPEKLSGYFLQTASGGLAEGATVKWKFAEVPEAFDVVVRQVVKDERIIFEWPAASGGYNTRVEMTFKPLDDRNTMVQISESGCGDQGILWQCRRLDAHDVLPEGLSRIRDQPAGRRGLLTGRAGITSGRFDSGKDGTERQGELERGNVNDLVVPVITFGVVGNLPDPRIHAHALGSFCANTR
jgi:uncharacterized protein YndB with AHSA1/START domain